MITLPSHPAPSAADVALIDFGALLTPSLGAPVQRIDRMGSRFRLAVTMPPIKGDKLGRQWIAKLIQGKQEGARIGLPLVGFKPGIPGTVKVNGAGQSGRTLVVDGATPNYVFRAGQPFNHITADDDRLLYFVTEEVIANGSGQATLPIETMLRVEPGDNDNLEFGQPVIEGFITGDEQVWSMAIGNFIGLAFEIRESR